MWSDKEIHAGALWKEEIERALDKAAAAVLLVSADFLASDFVMIQELPSLFRSAEKKGTVIIPVIIGPSLFVQSEIASFQSINPPELPLSKLSTHQRDEIFVRLAQAISNVMDQ